MAKYTLNLDHDYDFDLIGICSHSADYKVCWSINEGLGFQLTKSEEAFMVSGKGGTIPSSHSLYEWFDPEDEVDYYFIQNLDKESGKYLIPEKEQVDFFLIIRMADMVDIDSLLERLKEIQCVLTVLILEVESLKSANRLIFD